MGEHCYITCEAEGCRWFFNVAGSWERDRERATRIHKDIAAAILDPGDLCGPGNARDGWAKPTMLDD